MTQLRASSKAEYRSPWVEDASKDEPEDGIQFPDSNRSNTLEDKPQPSQSVDIDSLTSKFSTLSLSPNMQDNSLGEAHNSHANLLSNEEELVSDSASTYFNAYTLKDSEGVPANSSPQIPTYYAHGLDSFTFENIQVEGTNNIFSPGLTGVPYKAHFSNIKIAANNSYVGCNSEQTSLQQLACSVGADTEPGIQPAGNHASSGLEYRPASSRSDGTQGVERYVTAPGSPASPCTLTLCGETSASMIPSVAPVQPFVIFPPTPSKPLTYYCNGLEVRGKNQIVGLDQTGNLSPDSHHHGLSVDTHPDGGRVVTQDPSFHSRGP